MTGAPHPRMHGVTHVPGGPDPIPGIGFPSASATFPELVDVLAATYELRGYWRLGDGASPYVDISGHPNGPADAVLSAAGTAMSPDVAGALTTGDDGAVAFNYAGTADQDKLVIPDPTPGGAPRRFNFVSGDSSMTLAAWVKPGASASTFNGGILNNWRHSSTDCGWRLYVIWPSRLLKFERAPNGGAGGGSISPGGLPADEWAFVAATYDDSGGYKLYIDGALVDSDAATGFSLPAFNQGFNIGYVTATAGSHGFYGAVDEVTVWGAALTAADILALYEAGVTGGAGQAGQVPTSDGDGGLEYAYPTVKVDGTRYDEILTGTNLASTDNSDGTVTLDATGGGGEPVDDAQVWMPLTTVVAGVPDLVWDGTDNLIPTLTPIS